MKKPVRQIGLTLSELMVGLGTMAVVLGLAAPSVSDVMTKRKVAAAADTMAAFFENVRMMAVKRNEFATITYKMTDSGSQWCLGAVIGKESACDCMAQTPECLIDANPMILDESSFSEFGDVEASFGDGSVSFDPVRGILTDPNNTVFMEVRDSAQEFKVNIEVNATGGLRKCSPDSEYLIGYHKCS